MEPLGEAFNTMFTNLPAYLHGEPKPGRRRPVKAASREAGARHAPALTGRRWSGPIDGSRCAFALTALQAEPPVSSKGPVDATVVTLQAADVLANALLEEGLPRHELKTEPVVDHGEASADEAGDAG